MSGWRELAAFKNGAKYKYESLLIKQVQTGLNFLKVKMFDITKMNVKPKNQDTPNPLEMQISSQEVVRRCKNLAQDSEIRCCIATNKIVHENDSYCNVGLSKLRRRVSSQPRESLDTFKSPSQLSPAALPIYAPAVR